jgi:hypothetical protein
LTFALELDSASKKKKQAPFLALTLGGITVGIATFDARAGKSALIRRAAHQLLAPIAVNTLFRAGEVAASSRWCPLPCQKKKKTLC